MNDQSQKFPLIRWDVVKVDGRELQMVSVVREKGRSFVCAADAKEEALTGLVRCMAQAMDGHTEATGMDPADALTEHPTADGADVMPKSMAYRYRKEGEAKKGAISRGAALIERARELAQTNAEGARTLLMAHGLSEEATQEALHQDVPLRTPQLLAQQRDNS